MKKMLCMALLLGTTLTGFAKKEQEQTVTAKKTPEQAVADAHQELIGRIKTGLADKNAEKRLFNKVDEKQGEQFFLRNNEEIFKAFGLKQPKLKKVYNAVRGQGKSISYGVARPSKIDTTVNGNAVYFKTQDNIYTLAQAPDSSVVSDVEYRVTFGWKVIMTDDSVRTDKSNQVRLVSVAAAQQAYTHKEIEQMRAVAKKAIIDWYAALPERLDKTYANGAVGLTAMAIEPKEVTIVQNDKTFTSSQVPTIEIHIPFDVKPEEVDFYDPNPTSTYTLTPKFTVKIGDDLKTAQITNVTYLKGKTVEPLTNGEKEKRREAAGVVARNFAVQLPAYIENPTPEAKAKLEGLFVDPTRVVEVSNVSRNGRERIVNRSADRYLNRLKAKGMTVELGEPVEKGNLTTIEYPFHQTYESQTYSDYTDKTLVLKYHNNSYLIEKIVVKPGSTMLK